MAFEITGNAQTRFIQAAVLLHLLDPVRGEPTEHGLDRDTNEVDPQRERLLKRKFLDSFALICATRKDGDTVSAASIEEGLPEGTVVRLASNGGVAEPILHALREIVAILNSVASRVFTPLDKETEILRRIISLDIARVRHYLKDLRSAHDVLRERFIALESETAGSLPHSSGHSAFGSFARWIEQGSAIRDLPLDPAPEDLIWLVRWALEAKRTYLANLKNAFCTEGMRLPRWVYAILKLGRYAVASMALLQLASEVPHLFNPMRVEAVASPKKTKFAISEETPPLTSVLRRLVGGREEEYVSRLGRIWLVKDPETHFRNACSLNLPVHAEMQLLNFYDEFPARQPAFRFIGVSKKSCFLCHRFLERHPQSLRVSSCHQKLYLAWRVPPTRNSSIYKKYKSITTGLSRAMEDIAKHELSSRLGIYRPVPLDSSAGVSLAGLTNFNEAAGRSRSVSAMIQATGKTGTLETNEIHQKTPPGPIEVIELMSADDEVISRDVSDGPLITAKTLPVAEIVFHVKRDDGNVRQDIIALSDIIDAHSQKPSWAKLLEVLKDERGVAFKEEEECLMVNDRIRVVNERQLLACVQYLRNAMTWNSDVFVYSYQPNTPILVGS